MIGMLLVSSWRRAIADMAPQPVALRSAAFCVLRRIICGRRGGRK